MWIAYQALLALALLVAAPVLLARRGRHYLETLPGRLGRAPGGPATAEPPLWLHAVSVGEAGVAATLARALPAELPLVVTTITPTGQERARAALAGRARIGYLPFDLGFAVGRFFRRARPRALVLVEGDYWPLVLREARRRGLPVAVVNGRVGDATFRRLRRLRRLLGPRFAWLFGGVARFGVQSAADRDRLLALGVPAERVTVTGNLKFESPEPPRLPQLEAAVRALAGGRPVLVAGSTMAGEEERVLVAFAAAGGGAQALLVLAPRHPERWDEAARRVAEAGLPLVRRSDLGDPQGVPAAGAGTGPAPGSPTAAGAPPRRPGAAADPPPAVLLLDSLGELAGLYRAATGAFVGGTLLPTGGHNPLEPARFGLPVVVGPSMENFRQIAEDFDRAGAWERASDAAELGRVWRRWLDDPAAARAVGERAAGLVEAHRGALGKTLALLREAMPEVLADGESDGDPAAGSGAGDDGGTAAVSGAAGEPRSTPATPTASRSAPGRPAAGARP